MITDVVQLKIPNNTSIFLQSKWQNYLIFAVKWEHTLLLRCQNCIGITAKLEATKLSTH